jgi:hypothetical protein
MDAAASGQSLAGTLVTHLEGCNACSSAFTEEQLLFAAIDRSVGMSSNAPVPPSLVPRVQAQIIAGPDKTTWRSPVLAFATLSLVAGVAALSPMFHWRSTRVLSIRENPAAAPKVQFADSNKSIRSPVQTAPPALRRARVRSSMEVLVSREEQDGLERYAAGLRGRALENSARAAIASDPAFEIQPLEIAAMDLGQLTIEPLESGEYN